MARRHLITSWPCAGVLLWNMPGVSDVVMLPFTEEAVQRGLIFEMPDSGTPGAPGYGWGVAIADLNSNGLQDILILGAFPAPLGIFANDPGNPGYFIDRTYIEGGQTPKFVFPRPSGIAVADYNGDGLLDVYITQFMNPMTGVTWPSALLRNDGEFNFTDVAQQAGVTNNGNGQGAAWGDFDNDGWLDLYVANYGYPQYWNRQVHKNKLYRNLGNGTFEDVSVAQGVDDFGQGFSVAFTDIQRNGWLDLYLANDRGNNFGYSPNQLWRNDAGQYVNICDSSGACLELAAMCVGVGDFSGNGFADFYVTNLPSPHAYGGANPLLINQGDETFSEECFPAGVCQWIWSWAGIFFDFNNSGLLDLYVVNQWQNNNLFMNVGEYPVATVTEHAGLAGSPGASFNAAVGDVTGNGALDLLLNDEGTAGVPRNVLLYINHEGTLRNWIRFVVVGIPGSGNVHAVGANIEVTTPGGTQWREIYAGGNNFKAQNELVFHFGLGGETIAQQIVVNWPALGGTRTLTTYPALRTWSIYPEQLLGDFNGDGVINVFDLLALLTAWGQLQPGFEIMDLTGSGSIGVFDLLALLTKWGQLQ